MDPTLIAYASSLRQPGDKSLLWPEGPHRFRQLFASFLRQLGFAEDDYTPYSLRRGGATWFFQTSLSLDATIARGRWSCGKTAKQYIDEGTYQLAQVNYPGSEVQDSVMATEFLAAAPGEQEAERVSPLCFENLPARSWSGEAYKRQKRQTMQDGSVRDRPCKMDLFESPLEGSSCKGRPCKMVLLESPLEDSSCV